MGLSRENEFASTYPLPDEARLPRGAQRPKVTLGEAKHKSMGGGIGPAPALTFLFSLVLTWEEWGVELRKLFLPRTGEKL